MSGIRKFFGRPNTVKAGDGAATREIISPRSISTAETRPLPATVDLPLTAEALPEQKPELYSTAGSNGIRVVADPPGSVLDIVFVHGLTGNRDTTWTHKDGAFWPELLADDILGARIMTFGYDADVIKFWEGAGGNTLRTHGKNLASAVSDLRRTCRERPIVFIAHSLGGLVCEQALLCCREGNGYLDKVFQSTRGIIFMGTPHASAYIADLGCKLATYLNAIRRTNSTILGPLRQKSEVLIAVQQQFQQLLQKPDVHIDIYCFFEEKAIVGVGYIVPEHSAALSQYSNQSIAANHMNMTKFAGKNDEGYQKVLNRVLDGLELTESSNTNSGTIMKDAKYQETAKCHRLFRTSGYERHKDRNPDPVPGTCVWFLRHPNYASWRKSGASSILWVSADPGCGKSVLSRFLADKGLRPTEARTTCYFFFKDDNEDQKTATNALCAILHQLFDQKPDLLKYCIEPFSQNGDDLKGNIDKLWSIFITASIDPQAGEIICILDALDECRKSELRALLQKLCSFYENCPKGAALKFLVTSRPLQHIEYQFRDLSQKIPKIRLAGEEDTDQIRREIDSVIEYEFKKIHQSWPDDRENINALREEFNKVEHRTYLWLTLIFDIIREDFQTLTKRGRQRLFGTLPSSVNAAYTAILNKSKDKEQARKLLQIVCAATRPLSVKETFIAISIREDDKSVNDLDVLSGDLSKKLIRNLCGLFVSIIDARVYLLHQTAKEFLMTPENHQTTLRQDSGNIWEHSLSASHSNLVLAQSCMWYLQLEELYTRRPLVDRWKVDQLVSEYAFLDYSARNWAFHFRVSSMHHPCSLTTLGFSLCKTQADQYTSWEIVYWDGHRRSPLRLSLSLASHLGLSEVVFQILATPGVEVNAADEYGETPLSWAASEGHEAVVRQLLAAPGIQLNTAGKYGGTPLSWAASKGHEAVVRQLLAAPGVKINAVNEYGRTPLSCAALEGHEAVVRRLLAAPDVKVNAADKYARTPLSWAAFGGHEAVVRQLLAAPGIEINAAGKYARTPLSWAALGGHEAVVRQLLEAPGVEINTAGKYARTPLSCAAFGGHEAVVRQLLAAPGVEVNAAGKYGRTLLSWAALGGHEAVVRTLLGTPGVEVNVSDEYGRTPLSFAASGGHEAVVCQLLATHGVDVDAADREGRTPLSRAASRGYEAVVRQLLAARGVEINAADEYGMVPLSCAAFGGHEAVVRQLLAVPGVDVNAADREGRTPLSRAASKGYKAVVRQLLAAPGVEVNAADEYGETLLIEAQSPNYDVIRKLMGDHVRAIM